MADIDMIPRSYRAIARTRRTLRLAGIALAIVTVLGAASVGALRWRSAAIARQATTLEAAAAAAQTEHARAAVLQASYVRHAQDDSALRALRRAGEFNALTRAVETALTDRIWLTELTLERDVQAATRDGASDGAVEELVTPGATPASPQRWRLASTVQLKGQATDYAAITAFLSALGRAPGVSNLRLISSARSTDSTTIDFLAAGWLVQRKTP